jgi:lipid-binding SYLF domain-containing protein
MVQFRPVLHGSSTLKFLDKSDGWAIGSDPSVAVIDKGASASIDSTTLSHKVVAVPFGQNGLMAGVALQGSKITTYNPRLTHLLFSS